jgi:exosortase/archaeosortase family protein
VPVAVLANMVRVVAIGVVAHLTDHETAIRVYHDYSGYIVFGVGLGLLLGLGTLMRMDIKARVKRWAEGLRSESMRRT